MLMMLGARAGRCMRNETGLDCLISYDSCCYVCILGDLGCSSTTTTAESVYHRRCHHVVIIIERHKKIQIESRMTSSQSRVCNGRTQQ